MIKKASKITFATLLLGSLLFGNVAHADDGFNKQINNGDKILQNQQKQQQNQEQRAQNQQQRQQFKAELQKLVALYKQAHENHQTLMATVKSLHQKIHQAVTSKDQASLDKFKSELPAINSAINAVKQSKIDNDAVKQDVQNARNLLKQHDINGALAAIQDAESKVQARINAESQANQALSSL